MPSKPNRRLALLSLLSLAALASACGDDAPSRPTANARTGKPKVLATFEPLRWVAARLAGDLADVSIALPHDADPAHWTPEPSVVQAMQEADLLLVNGSEFETWLDTTSLPRATTVHLFKAMRDPPIEREDVESHSHGGGAAHVHGKIDGHTWVDPRTLRQQAEAVRDALVRLLPAHEAAIGERFLALGKDLEALHASFAAIAVPEGMHLVAAHGAYDYLARRLGWKMANLDLDPEQALDPAALDAIAKELDGVQAKWILWEDEPVAGASGPLRERFGLESIVFEPAEALDPERRARGEDYLTVMQANAERLAGALGRT